MRWLGLAAVADVLFLNLRERAAVFAGALPPALVATTLLAAVLSALFAGLAGLLPAAWVRRLPPAPLLAGE